MTCCHDWLGDRGAFTITVQDFVKKKGTRYVGFCSRASDDDFPCVSLGEGACVWQWNLNGDSCVCFSCHSFLRSPCNSSGDPVWIYQSKPHTCHWCCLNSWDYTALYRWIDPQAYLMHRGSCLSEQTLKTVTSKMMWLFCADTPVSKLCLFCSSFQQLGFCLFRRESNYRTGTWQSVYMLRKPQWRAFPELWQSLTSIIVRWWPSEFFVWIGQGVCAGLTVIGKVQEQLSLLLDQLMV